MRRVSAAAVAYSDGDAETPYASGPIEHRWSSSWMTEEGIMAGEADVSGPIKRLPGERDVDRRRLFAVAVSSATFQRQSAAGFGWDGGVPDEQIDISDWPDDVFSDTDAATISCLGLWVTTDKMVNVVFTYIAVVLARWYFIEGELYADWRVWDPPDTSTAL